MPPAPAPKIQSPAAVAGLTVVTLNFYSYFWYYRVNREMRDLGRAYDVRVLAETTPWASVLALIAGGFLILPGIATFIGTARRVDACERLAGIGSGGILAVAALSTLAYGMGAAAGSGPGAAALASLVAGSLTCWLLAITAVQRRLNAVWRKDLLPATAALDELIAAA